MIGAIPTSILVNARPEGDHEHGVKRTVGKIGTGNDKQPPVRLPGPSRTCSGSYAVATGGSQA